MDENKSAMYAKAGRSNGWTKGTSEKIAVKLPPLPVVEDDMTLIVEESQQSVIHMPPHIPEPPEVILPILQKQPEPHEEVKTFDGCQRIDMAFVEMQEWHDVYEPDHGISRGTIFAELDLPFEGKGACKHE